MSAGPVHVVVMGVSATGKTQIGERMARSLGFDFLEGDSYHPESNIEKMEEGIPLTDADRAPWLRTLAGLLSDRDDDDRSTVLTCSALKRSYRDILRKGAPSVYFVHLHAPYDILVGRMSKRTAHFMPTSLLESQFETLEPLGSDEDGVQVDVSPPMDAIAREAVDKVRWRFGL
jgi:gluconokinase